MIIDLIRLNNGIDSIINIDRLINFSKEDLDQADLLDFKQAHVKGYIKKDAINNIVINLNVTGIMVLECARTLKPVDYPININIEVGEDELLEIDENFKKSQNSIDIFPIIWENILVEIPMRVVSEEAKDLKIENSNQETTGAFEKLKDLL